MSLSRIDELILDYQAGALDAEGVAELDTALREDPAAGERFAYWSKQAIALREVSAARAERRSGAGRASRRLALSTERRQRRRSRWPLAVAAAAALMAAGILAILALRPTPSGWSVNRDAGEVARDGSTLPATTGLALALGDEFTAGGTGGELTAADGSFLRLSPGTRLRVGADEIALGDGLLAASIAKRPEHPLRIATATATATIIGTVFSIESSAGGTRLRVDEGRVRLARGADTIEVPAGQECDAAPTGALALANALGRDQAWLCRFDFSRSLPLGTLSATFVPDARGPGQGAARAEPVAVEPKNGIKGHRLKIMGPRAEGPGLFTYDPRAVVRCTFRFKHPGKMAAWELFMTCDQAGNYFTLYHKQEVTEQGWTTVDLPLAQLDAKSADRAGAICHGWIIDSYHSDSELEIAEFGVLVPGQGK